MFLFVLFNFAGSEVNGEPNRTKRIISKLHFEFSELLIESAEKLSIDCTEINSDLFEIKSESLRARESPTKSWLWFEIVSVDQIEQKRGVTGCWFTHNL
jgi:hypothetical protein